ncbi:DUF4382 domain-containing protein [Sorangium sp. So ce887]|uniref:DUF4382 domain-containing protein n=1 Tax=Sorangium sp. So ce887 TaxID=3133324 RepID=UPI003F5EED6D
MRAFSSHVVLFGLFALSIAGCGGGGTVEVGVTAQPLQVPLAPPAGGDVAIEARLAVTITEVSVHIAGDEGSPGGDGDSADREDAGEKGWTTLFSGEVKVDLLDAMSTEEFLGSNEVPAGKITQVRLVLAGAELVDAAGTSPVSCPSCSQSGLKIVTEGAVEVSPGGTLHLTLDVDQASSLTQDESGYRLDPVIKIAQAEER